MKTIIKKRIKNLIVPASLALIAATLAIGTCHTFSENALKDNSSINQISQYQEGFDVVSGYQHTNGERLKHNDGEPIYIQIDNRFSPEQKETIKNALDFIFGIVGDINNNYKYQITASGKTFLKQDPYGYHSETNGGTSSKVYDLEGFEWNDDSWLEQRRNTPVYDKPVNIYEVHLGSWKKH